MATKRSLSVKDGVNATFTIKDAQLSPIEAEQAVAFATLMADPEKKRKFNTLVLAAKAVGVTPEQLAYLRRTELYAKALREATRIVALEAMPQVVHDMQHAVTEGDKDRVAAARLLSDISGTKAEEGPKLQLNQQINNVSVEARLAGILRDVIDVKPLT